MTNASRASLPTSPPARIEWRPSRLLQGALVLLGACALAAPWLGGMPPAPAVAVSCIALVLTATFLRREARRRPCTVVWQPGQPHVELVDAHGVARLTVRRLDTRGRLMVLHLEDDTGARRLVWWPDTLDAEGRRALRLAAAARPDRLSILPLIGG